MGIEAEGFQEAWCKACRLLLQNRGSAWNLFVTIRDPLLLDQALHEAYDAFCKRLNLLPPKDVAYTIFPDHFAQRRSAEQLFSDYNDPGGLFHRLQRRKRSWGTYFRRLTHYDIDGHSENQLDNIVRAINNRQSNSQAAYTMLIQRPGTETTKPLGGPCLNYLALQIPSGDTRKINLLAVYRNHAFLQRTYGNYLGLGRLLQFICLETESEVGKLSCFSSHAYLDKRSVHFNNSVQATYAGLGVPKSDKCTGMVAYFA